jgi:head-tail adaptor
MGDLISSRMFSMLTKFYSSSCAIQEATETRDAAGQPIKSWGNVTGMTALACRLSPTGGSERKTPTQIYSIATHVIELSGNYPTITTKMRAVISSVNYDILLVESDGTAMSTRLVCEVVK